MGSKILIVENEENVCRNLAKRMTEAGHQASFATTTEQAQKEIQSGDALDVLVVNISMSGYSGFSLIDDARGRSPQVKVIMASEHGQKEDVIKALRTGASDYFEKPFNLDELAISIQQQVQDLEKTGSKQASVVSLRPNLQLLPTLPSVSPLPADSVGGGLSYTEIKRKWSNSFEKEYLRDMLNKNGGNVSAAARSAKLDRSNFLRLLRKHGLSAQEYRKAA